MRYTLGFERTVLKVVSLMTLVLFLPSGITVWNFIPVPTGVAAAQLADLPRLDEQQLAQLVGGGLPGLAPLSELSIAALKEGSENPPATDIAPLSSSAAAESLVASANAYQSAVPISTVESSIDFYENAKAKYILPHFDTTDLLERGRATKLTTIVAREQLAQVRVIQQERANKPATTFRRGAAPKTGRVVFRSQEGVVTEEEESGSAKSISSASTPVDLSSFLGLNIEEMTPEEQLAEADIRLGAGRIAEAALLYFNIQDIAPGSTAARFAMSTMLELGGEAGQGEISYEQLTLFMQNLPTFEQCHSVNGKYWITLAHQIAANVSRAAGNEASVTQHNAACRDISWRALQEHPDDPTAVLLARAYLKSAHDLGTEAVTEAKSNLDSILRDDGIYDMARFAALSELGIFLWRYEKNNVDSLLRLGSLAEEYEAGLYAQYVEFEGFAAELRAQLKFAVGYAYFQLNARASAVEMFEEVLRDYPEAGAVTDWARYYKALSTHFLHHQDPIIGAQAFIDALNEAPASVYADVELFVLGGIYLRADDFDAAESVFEDLVAGYPDSQWRSGAERALQQVAEQRAAATARMAVLLENFPIDYNKWCGPYALAKLMETRGVEVTTEQIVQAVAPDEVAGASMLDLADVAMTRGIPLQGLEEKSLDRMRAPFIAHFSEQHYVLVSEIQDDRVTLHDVFSPVQYVSIQQFLDRWSGYSLVLPELVASESYLQPTAMDAVYGGSGGLGGTSDVFPADVGDETGTCVNAHCGPRGCPTSNSAKGYSAPSGSQAKDGMHGSSSGAGLSSALMSNSSISVPKSAGGDSPAPLNKLGPHGPMNANPSALISIDTGASGSRGFLNPVQSSQSFDEMEVAFPVYGALDIGFKRTFTNPFGYIRGYYGSTAMPFRNNIGRGWTHSYNVHLRVSSLEGYIMLVDHNANATQFTKLSSDSTYDYYSKSAGALSNSLRHIDIRKVKSDGTYIMTQPGAATIKFSAMIDSSGERYSRMTSIEDIAANQITFSYDDTKRSPYGILTKIDAPGSDTRYLELQYNSGATLITKLRFMADSSTEVRYVEYIYDGDWLEKVRVNGNTGHEVIYDYTQETDGTNIGTYISQVTDRAGVNTYFDFDYDFSSTLGYFQPTKMRIKYASGLDVQVKKIGWSTNYTEARVEGYVGADFDVMSDDYTSDALFRWETDTAANTDSIGIEYFRYFYDPTNDSSYDEWRYEYNTSNQAVLTKAWDPNNVAVATLEYTADGHRKKTTSYGRVLEDLTYGTSGSAKHYVQSGKREGDVVSTVTYDSDNRATQIVHPADVDGGTPGAGDGTRVEFDSNNMITKVIQPDDAEAHYRYDTRGNLTKVILPDDNPTTPTHPVEYWYNDFGVVTKVKNPLGKYTHYTYVDEGCGSCGGSAGLKLTEIEDDDSHITQFAYDDNGNQVLVTDALSREYTYVYDTMNRMVSVEDPDGRISSMDYNLIGQVTKQTGPTGKEKQFVYDYMGQLIESTEVDVAPGNDITVVYTYDKLGQLTKVVDGNGHETLYVYVNGRLSYSEDEVGKKLHYFYDSSGRMTKTAAGATGTVDPVTYAYSSTTGQLMSVTYDNGGVVRTVTYDYDPVGKLTNVVDWLDSGVSTGHFFEYEPDTGRMTKYVDFDGAELEYEYNVGGQVTKMTDYDGNVTTYTYTDTGELSTLTAPGSKVWDFDYNELHQRTQVTYPNGMKALYVYDTSNRLTKIEYNDGGGTPVVLDGWEYGLTDDGNIARMASLLSEQQWYYFYDGKSRLTDALRTNVDGWLQFREQYAYDDGDNMLAKDTFIYDASTSFGDNFSDGDYTSDPAWTVGSGTWAVDTTGDYYLKNTGGSAQMRIGNSDDDIELIGSYRLNASTSTSDYVEFTMRYSFDNSPPDYVSVRFHPDKMELRERYNGSFTTLDFPDVTTDVGDWHQVWIRCVDDVIEVLRHDESAGFVLVGRMEGLQTDNTSRLYVNGAGSGIEANFDDLIYLKHKTGVDSATDDFSDGNYTADPAWSVGAGAWSVTSGELCATQSTGSNNIALPSTSPDNQVKVSVNKTQSGGELRVYTREISGTQKTFLYISDSSVAIKEQNPTTVTKASASITTTANVWYDYHLVTEGSRMEVWRGPQGGPLELVLETDALTNFETDSMQLISLNGAQGKFDNVQFISHDPKTTTFAYNDANELTTMTEGGTTTTYTYDDWGRTISKTDGTHTATYGWRFGDKLNSYTTTFPGEANVFFNYDGLGKRRLKLLNPGASTDADYTWYRWDAGWNMIGEYAAGTDTGTSWDIGISYFHSVFALGSAEQSGEMLGFLSVVNLYPIKDRVGTIRGHVNDTLLFIAKIETLPFGEILHKVAGGVNWRFAKNQLDAEANLYYAFNRYYSPTSGRWISRDPLGQVDGLNIYSYVRNNPTNYSDPMGLKRTRNDSLDDVPGWVDMVCDPPSPDFDPTEIVKCLKLAKKLAGQNSVLYCSEACLCVENNTSGSFSRASCQNCCNSTVESGGVPNPKQCGVGCAPSNDLDGALPVSDLIVIALCLVILLYQRRQKRE